MIVDSSVIVGILLGEPNRKELLDAIMRGSPRLMSAATFVECGLRIVGQKGGAGLIDLQMLVQQSAIEIAPVDEDQAIEAVRAFEKYGKGRHPAALNYGDCFSYALAKVRREPLLYQGNDFALTDLA